jgi:hypothetical protein
MRRTNPVAAIALLFAMGGAPAVHGVPRDTTRQRDNVVLEWNAALLSAVRSTRFGPMFTARALAIVHTCMYDAWAAYDGSARGAAWGEPLRRPPSERTHANKEVAVSYAAYRALVDLLPSQEPLFVALMLRRGLDVADDSMDPSTAPGVGNRTWGAGGGCRGAARA